MAVDGKFHLDLLTLKCNEFIFVSNCTQSVFGHIWSSCDLGL